MKIGEFEGREKETGGWGQQDIITGDWRRPKYAIPVNKMS